MGREKDLFLRQNNRRNTINRLIKANSLKSGDAKLKGLHFLQYASQLPYESLSFDL